MKKIFPIMITLALIVMLILPIMAILTGCAKCVSTEYETVQVEIVDQHHRGSYRVPMKVGKVTTMRTVPASYSITVTYDGVEYTISGYDTWHEYKDLIGETVPATLEIRTYDDGTMKLDIIALGEEESE